MTATSEECTAKSDVERTHISATAIVASASQASAWYQRARKSSTKNAAIVIQNAAGVPQLTTWMGSLQRKSSV